MDAQCGTFILMNSARVRLPRLQEDFNGYVVILVVK